MPESLGAPADRFPPTRLSVLTRLRDGDDPARAAAFAVLAGAYWRPVYAYLRLQWREEPADAEDLTQGFLAAAWEKGFLGGYDPSRARFRTFLRTCLDRHVMNHRKAARAGKRGGGNVELRLDFADAEGQVRTREIPDQSGPEELFHREFVRELFTRAVTRLREEFEQRGRGAAYAAFERHDLGPDDGAGYAAIAAELGLTVSQVTNHLHAARRRFRELVLDQLRELSGSDAEFREEAREILGVELE